MNDQSLPSIQRERKITTFLQSLAPHLRGYALENCLENEFLKSAALAISENPELSKCLTTDSGKMSLYRALKYAVTTGLSLHPHAGQAALIGYGGAVRYQVTKNGLIELAMRSGRVTFITADTVRENDQFEISRGMDGDSYTFVPARKNRGGIDGFFASMRLVDGTGAVKWMTTAEVEKHRDQFSEAAGRDAWENWFPGMGEKTAIKALLRGVTISPELANALGTDDACEARGVEPPLGGKPDTPGSKGFGKEKRQGATPGQVAEKLQAQAVEKIDFKKAKKADDAEVGDIF